MKADVLDKTSSGVVGILALVSITAVAQENRSEISVQGTGFFTKDTDGNRIRQHATDTGGFLVGYRYNFNLEEAERAHILTTLKKTRWVLPGNRMGHQ